MPHQSTMTFEVKPRVDFDFTGPSPEKRLSDLRSLGSAYIKARNASDAVYYPDKEREGWCACDLPVALDDLLHKVLRGHRCGNDLNVSFECVLKIEAARRAASILLAAFQDCTTPSVEDHRLVVAALTENWPFHYSVGFTEMWTYHWPVDVIPSGDREFVEQTPEAEARWRARVERHQVWKDAQRERELGIMGWLDPAVASSKVERLRGAVFSKRAAC